ARCVMQRHHEEHGVPQDRRSLIWLHRGQELRAMRPGTIGERRDDTGERGGHSPLLRALPSKRSNQRSARSKRQAFVAAQGRMSDNGLVTLSGSTS
ncbi:MAG TPA: hypothetical protein VHH34_04930, partial [Pseudonocardiaceae bacterium]|nr:hypothetical protein [Pseudonocardiaceae bacterium]